MASDGLVGLTEDELFMMALQGLMHQGALYRPHFEERHIGVRISTDRQWGDSSARCADCGLRLELVSNKMYGMGG